MPGRLFSSLNRQHAGVFVLIEADDDCLAADKRWRTQITRWPEHRIDHFVAHAIFSSKRSDLLSLGNDKLRRFLSERLRIVATQLAGCRDRFFGRQPVGLQEPGGFGTTRSSLAEIVPIDRLAQCSTPSVVVAFTALNG